MPVTLTPHARPRRGLTVLELVLAVAVIAVLVGLLLPSLSAARREARMARCTSNLRQLGMALSAYQADYGALPNPMRLVKSVPDRRLLWCPEDPGDAQKASSYTFRAVLPPDWKPYWNSGADLPADTVLVICKHHQGQQRHVGDHERVTVTEPTHPWQLVLRASGQVQRIRTDRIREVLVPGKKPTFARIYPGEGWYEQAQR